MARTPSSAAGGRPAPAVVAGRRLAVGLGAGALAAGASAGAAYVLRRRLGARPGNQGGGIRAHVSVTLNGTPEQVYAEWRDLPKLPHVLSHLREVRVLDPRRSRWTAVGVDGTTLTWHVEITDDVPGHELAWRSLPPATVPMQGHVRFSPGRGGRGTEVHIDLTYTPGDGRDAAWAAFAAAQERDLRRDLRRLSRMPRS